MDRTTPVQDQLEKLTGANFLSPLLQPAYSAIMEYLSRQVGATAELGIGQSLEEFAEGKLQLGFLCGLLYVHLARSEYCPVELLAAPVLCGERYHGLPIYFSDVVVHKDSPFTSFADLAGCTWAYNERASHSGWNLVCYSLYARGQTLEYFARTVETGTHQKSLELVMEGKADATALDSQVLAVMLRQDSDLAARVRVIEALGPSPIPPVVISKSLDVSFRDRLRTALLNMHNDPSYASALRFGEIERFVPVTDTSYQHIHDMFTFVQQRVE
ncbi:transporter substrate-binding domain-containing protein [Ktedonosporobacter rubrisoli]|uniref:Transporter substrate-binding domain-containing protein n=1 Tax=Ktedonosporobacter rubrisoli TaxID=2509675 RepID=A0A4P6K353_KTERU|nr:PhnD/SsuA/transferrin family substrate-binding protein [Ktedonosporobacter rubrisoli]QBD82599.1 transporter substrate-binding domain-containing protein [Ktedonosporobacter rubrisoli]